MTYRAEFGGGVQVQFHTLPELAREALIERAIELADQHGMRLCGHLVSIGVSERPSLAQAPARTISLGSCARLMVTGLDQHGGMSESYRC